MSAIANIVAFDGAATPVSHTFLPVSVTREKGVIRADYREGLTGVPTYACPRIYLLWELLKNGVYRVERRTIVPVMEAVTNQNAAGYTAAPKVAHELTDSHVGFFHQRSDIAGRRLVRQLGLNISGSISTSVAAVTTGPVPELFDQLVAPT